MQSRPLHEKNRHIPPRKARNCRVNHLGLICPGSGHLSPRTSPSSNGQTSLRTRAKRCATRQLGWVSLLFKLARSGAIRSAMPPEPNEPAADLSSSPGQPSMSPLDETDAAPAAAPTTPQLQRTQTDSSLRSCFICLQTPSETPNAAWVNACPCSLEAHEDCMLRWISEHERESTKTLRCPACKGKIQTTEPKDSFVGFRDRLHKMYSRITPAILLGVVTGCSSRCPPESVGLCARPGIPS